MHLWCVFIFYFANSRKKLIKTQSICWWFEMLWRCCYIDLMWPNKYRLLTHWGRDEMTAIFQTTLSNEFSWMKMYQFRLIFRWSLFLRVQLTVLQHWFRLWLGADQATSHYLNQWWLDYRRIYPSLGLNELIWKLRLFIDTKRFSKTKCQIRLEWCHNDMISNHITLYHIILYYVIVIPFSLSLSLYIYIYQFNFRQLYSHELVIKHRLKTGNHPSIFTFPLNIYPAIYP